MIQSLPLSGLVVVTHFDIERVAVLKSKANSPLIIHGDCEETLAVARQGMESVSSRHLQVIDGRGQVDIFQFPHRPLNDVRRQSLRLALFEKILGPAIGERLDYRSSEMRPVTRVKSR